MKFDNWRFPMSRHDDDTSVMIYMLAGVGLGAIIGAAAGLLFAPKAGTEILEDIADRFKEIKGKGEEWYAEQKAKRAIDNAVDEIGA